jgi:hypothetical protein
MTEQTDYDGLGNVLIYCGGCERDVWLAPVDGIVCACGARHTFVGTWGRANA